MVVRPALLCLLVAACSGDAETSTSDTGSQADADTDADADADADADTDADTDPTTATGDSGGGIPDFQADVVPIFERSCGATDNACHSAVAYNAAADAECKGWLSLENRPLGSTYESANGDVVQTGCPDRTLYERLTELDSWQCALGGSIASGGVEIQRRYAEPNDLANSYLWQKVVGGGDLCYTSGGTLSSEMPMGVPLPQPDLDTLQAWLLAGAPE